MKKGEEDIYYDGGSGGATKTAHAYKPGCQKYVQGATEEAMRKAAGGGDTGE